MTAAFVSAHSSRRDTAAAMGEVLEQVPRDARFVLVYAGEQHDLAVVARRAQEHVPEGAVMGCTTSGELSTAGPLDGGVTLLAGVADDLYAVAASAPGVIRSPEAAARRLADSLRGAALPETPHRLLVVHAPGFTAKEAGWEHRAYPLLEEELGSPLVVVGGSAGDGLKFLGGQVHQGGTASGDAVVGMLIATPRPIVSSLQHGYRPTDRTARVTKSRGTHLLELDGVRPVRRYAELIGIKEKALTRGAGMVKLGGLLPKRLTAFSQTLGMTPQRLVDTLPFYQHTIRHPLGIPVGAGRYQATFARLSRDDGTIELFGPVASGTTVTLLTQDDDAFVSAPATALRRCRESLGSTPAATLLIECAGRKLVLGRRVDDSFQELRSLVDHPFAGFFSHGEQGPQDGPPVTCNNYSVVAVCFGDAPPAPA